MDPQSLSEQQRRVAQAARGAAAGGVHPDDAHQQWEQHGVGGGHAAPQGELPRGTLVEPRSDEHVEHHDDAHPYHPTQEDHHDDAHWQVGDAAPLAGPARKAAQLCRLKQAVWWHRQALVARLPLLPVRHARARSTHPTSSRCDHAVTALRPRCDHAVTAL